LLPTKITATTAIAANMKCDSYSSFLLSSYGVQQLLLHMLFADTTLAIGFWSWSPAMIFRQQLLLCMLYADTTQQLLQLAIGFWSHSYEFRLLTVATTYYHCNAF
jgi:hypothetical protein